MARPGRTVEEVGSSMRPGRSPSPRARLRPTRPSAATVVPVGTVVSASALMVAPVRNGQNAIGGAGGAGGRGRSGNRRRHL